MKGGFSTKQSKPNPKLDGPDAKDGMVIEDKKPKAPKKEKPEETVPN